MNDAISPSAAIADLRKPIAAIEPEFIGFASAQAAIDHREGAGGWIFIPDNAAGAVWFSLNFTAGAVMRHHAAKGSGQLI